MKRYPGRILFALLSTLSGLPAQADPARWLIAAPSETVRGGRLELELVRPAGVADWPTRLQIRVGGDAGHELVELAPAPLVDKSVEKPVDKAVDSPRRSYVGRLPERMVGLLRLQLADDGSNRIALIAEAADPVAHLAADEAAPLAARRFDPLPEHEPALSALEPVYFVAGTRGGANARYQLSFKYRLFDPDSAPVGWLPGLAGLHFGYTQTSIWDLAIDSSPFRDTSYRPTLFWQGRLGAADGGARPRYLRLGYEHESNGKDGSNSRSVDLAFVQPVWRRDFADGDSLIFAPKFYAYLDREDNRDIADFRGHADWLLRYGDENAWVLSARLRYGRDGHASGQLDLSRRLREQVFARTGGFFHIQMFNGYGESLLDYDRKRGTQLRFGFSIVR